MIVNLIIIFVLVALNVVIIVLLCTIVFMILSIIRGLF